MANSATQTSHEQKSLESSKISEMDSAHKKTPEPKEAPNDTYFTTKLDDLVSWARRNSMWPYPFGTACCGIELMSVMGPKYDIARFGAEVVRFSPKQSDLLIVAGTITAKMAPVLKRIYDQMPEPKWVMSMGACASSGGFYRAYHVVQGIDSGRFGIPVDVFIPGCPPTPEAVLDGLMQLQEKIKNSRQELVASAKNSVTNSETVTETETGT